jgi:hypothetical protein
MLGVRLLAPCPCSSGRSVIMGLMWI